MDSEIERQFVRDARLKDIILQLDGLLAELDDLGLSRIAISLSEAIELAKAARISSRSD